MTKSRVEKEDTGHTFLCECGFMSSGHATQKQANARGDEHKAEHESGEPMREIGEFMAGQE